MLPRAHGPDLRGDPAAVFVFQLTSGLTTASDNAVVFLDDAASCNVYWRVAESATIGTGTDFVGTVMASTSISMGTPTPGIPTETPTTPGPLVPGVPPTSPGDTASPSSPSSPSSPGDRRTSSVSERDRDDALSSTGASTTPLLLAGGVLLVLGVATLAVRRRSTRR